MTSGLRRGRFSAAPRSACALPRSLVSACFVEVEAAPLASQLPIAAATTPASTHLLCRLRRRCHREHLPALGTSTTHQPERPIGDTLRPLALGDVAIDVADVLPRT